MTAMSLTARVRASLPGLALLAFLPLASAAQEADFQEPVRESLQESVEIKLVTLDVTVTGEDGAPLPGLTVEDFEVKDDGAPMEVTHFTSSREPLHLILLFDDVQLSPGERTTAVAAVRRELGRLLGSADRVQVARQGREVRVELPFTTSREDLDRALSSLETTAPGIPVRLAAERALLEEIRLGDTPTPSLQGPGGGGDRLLTMTAESGASSTLVSVRSFAAEQRSRTLQKLAALGRFVSSLAELPGRKAILFVSSGFDLRPGERVYEAWLAKYRLTEAARMAGSVNLEAASQDLRRELRSLVAEAGASRVAFYAMGSLPTGTGAGARPDLRLTEAPRARGEASPEEALRLLGDGTGGAAFFNWEGLDLLAGRLAADRQGAYTLAYASPHPGDGVWHPVAVRVRRPGARARTVEGYLDKTSDQRLADRAAASLLLDLAENPLGLEVALGEPKKERGGGFTVPVTLKLPLSRLTLLPKGNQHEGRIAILLLAQGPDGRLVPGQKQEVPILIPNTQLVAAMARTGVYNLQLRMGPGEHRLAVAVHDEIGGLDSALSLRVDAGRK